MPPCFSLPSTQPTKKYLINKQKSHFFFNLINAKNTRPERSISGHYCYPFYSMSMSSSYAEPPSTSNYNPPVPIIVTVILLILFFFGFFIAYFCKSYLEHLVAMWNHRSNPSSVVAATAGANMSNGLDPELIQAFPTFYYSAVKEFRREKYGLECAICLADFSDDDMLRLLTICCHVFHKECVDLWLESHKTCPFCRGELDVPPRESIEKSPILVHIMHQIGANQSSLQDAVCIDIKEDNNEKVDGGEDEEQAASLIKREQQHRKRDKMERFSRSHSTGHSITRTRSEEEDRYTLRLLDHVKIKIVRGHNSAGSCIAFGDFASPSDYRKEGSSEASETRRGDIDKV